MPQVFHPAWNSLSKATIVGGVFTLALLGALAVTFFFSSYGTGADRVVRQPIAFGHEHHVGLLGFDCRYCHLSVETDAFAGIPATDVCMKCHSEIWADDPMIAPIHASMESGTPIHWKRVHNLGDFAYFDHSIHVAKGVGCVSCHGRVDKMPIVYQAEPLTMKWCLDCHRDPRPHLRPLDAVFDSDWIPPADIAQKRAEWMKERDVQSKTSCSHCHR